MASVGNWIVERRDTRRMCHRSTSNGPEKCLFHCWSTESKVIPPSNLRGGHSGGTISETVGILEFEDGHLEKLSINDFRFIDGGQFKQWAWPIEDVDKKKGEK